MKITNPKLAGDLAAGRAVGSAMNRLVNLNFATQNFYERRLSRLYHAWQIRFLLEPDK
jgi:hypothetical protein